MIEIPNLKEYNRFINGNDCLRISSIKSFIDNLPELPEYSNECLIVVRGTDGIDYKSTIKDLVLYLNGIEGE